MKLSLCQKTLGFDTDYRPQNCTDVALEILGFTPMRKRLPVITLVVAHSCMHSHIVLTSIGVYHRRQEGTSPISLVMCKEQSAMKQAVKYRPIRRRATRRKKRELPHILKHFTLIIVLLAIALIILAGVFHSSTVTVDGIALLVFCVLVDGIALVL